MTVHSPKLERFEDKADRQVPLFPPLRAELEASWNAAEPGAVYILPTIRILPLATFQSRLHAIIRRASLVLPKPAQNLRASRATELADQFPGHVAAAWLGHCEATADKHYRHTLDSHFDAAVKPAVNEDRAAQNPAQQSPAQPRTHLNASSDRPEDFNATQGESEQCDLVRKPHVFPQIVPELVVRQAEVAGGLGAVAVGLAHGVGHQAPGEGVDLLVERAAAVGRFVLKG